MSKLNKGILSFAKVSSLSLLLPPHVQFDRGDGTTVVAVEEFLQGDREGECVNVSLRAELQNTETHKTTA